MNINLNPVSQVSPMMQFRYKGMSVNIETVSQRSHSLYRDLMQARNDCRSILQYQRKYKSYNSSVRDALNSLRGYSHQTRYRLVIEMNGESMSQGIENPITRNVAGTIKQCRKKLIERARMKVTRYAKVHSQAIRPHNINYRYSGNINAHLQVYGTSRVGYVHSEPNQILRLHETRLSTRMFDAVRPMTAERHVGIEIECGVNVSRERLGFLLRPFAGYVMVKGDGSVNVSNRTAVELNICAPISKYRDIVKGVTDVLNSPEVSARVNKTCGLHVHLDVREWRNDFGALQDKYARLISVQGILYSMQPRSRQDNTYCQKSKSRSIVRGASRYQGINAQSIWKYTTIETRLHAGTTDYTKITNWCDLLVGVMYSTGAVPKRALTKIESVAKYFPIASSMLAYISQRVRQFANGVAEESESEAA